MVNAIHCELGFYLLFFLILHWNLIAACPSGRIFGGAGRSSPHVCAGLPLKINFGFP
jgi:hypothetical protein